MAQQQKTQPRITYGTILGAMLTSMIIFGFVIYLLAPDIDKYLKSLVPPNIVVKPSEVDVTFPDQTEVIKAAVSKKITQLTYYELSLLVDAEFTAFLRMHNHYKQKPSAQLKSLMKEQATRIDKVMAFREEAWVAENRELGSRTNDFSPLKIILDDVMKGLEQPATARPKRVGSF